MCEQRRLPRGPDPGDAHRITNLTILSSSCQSRQAVLTDGGAQQQVFVSGQCYVLVNFAGSDGRRRFGLQPDHNAGAVTNESATGSDGRRQRSRGATDGIDHAPRKYRRVDR